jgi:hypothetical protein
MFWATTFKRMPIELYTWAMGWVLAGQLYSGIGAEVQLDRQRLELRYVPEAVYPWRRQRTSLAYTASGFGLHLGMTPMGPGHMLRLSAKGHHVQLFQTGRQSWIQWRSPWSFLPAVVYAKSEGWSATAKAGGFQARLTQKGQQHVSYQGAYFSGQWNQRGERWQSRLQIRRFYAMASGRSQWESSRLGISVQGNFFEFQEEHSLQGMNLQLTAKLRRGNWSLFGWYQEGVGPSAWMWRTEGQVQGRLALTLQRGSMPWLDHVAVRYAHTKGFSVSARVHRSGGSVQFSAKNFSLDLQPRFIQVHWRQHVTIAKPKASIRAMDAPVAPPSLKIITSGTPDHPAFRCYVEDANGRTFLVHLMPGELQWKTHLPPGTYQWKPVKPQDSPGYSVTFPEEGFELRAGETSGASVQVMPRAKTIIWVEA